MSNVGETAQSDKWFNCRPCTSAEEKLFHVIFTSEKERIQVQLSALYVWNWKARRPSWKKIVPYSISPQHSFYQLCGY